MVPTSQKIHRLTEEGPKTEEARYFHPGEEKAQEGLHCSISVFNGQLQRERRLSLHELPDGEDTEQWVQAAPGEASS